MIMSSIWVKDHYILGTFHINFGARFFYNFELESLDLSITRTLNEQFIYNFYSDIQGGADNLELVSAIVGNNGSGKSTICKIIRDIANTMSKPRHYLEFEEAIVVYDDPLNNTSTYRRVIREPGVNFDLSRDPITSVDIILKPDIVKDNENAIDQATIFYSPFLDNNASYIDFDETHDIDISLQRIIHKDAKEKLLDSSSMLAEHYYKNLARHYALMDSEESKILKEIGIPTYEDAFVQYQDVYFDDSNTSNITSDFQDVYQSFLVRWRKELDVYKSRVDDNGSIINKSAWLHLWFLHGLINTIYESIESTNNLLEEAIFTDIDILKSKSLEDAVDYFLENHYFKESSLNNISIPKLPVKEIRLFIKTAKLAVGEIDRRYDRSNDRKFRASFNDVSALLGAQSKFIEAMRPIGRISGFITAAPGTELSSGEKAMIDLFSRFYDIRYEARQRVTGNTKKSLLTLIIDEGDIGFHPQWKKKYILNLIKVLPKMLVKRDVRVQIIFSTHDPLTLSDIPNYNVVYTRKEYSSSDKPQYTILHPDDSGRPKHSFGANITQMYLNSFFIEDGLVGELAVEKIDRTIKWLNSKNDIEDSEHYRKIIELIDEPVIRTKLSEMFSTKTGDKSLEIQAIDERIQRLEAQKKNIGNDKN